MAFEYSIEVTSNEGDSSKSRGDLLERLAKRVLRALQFEHVRTDVRVTGCELDVIAEHRQTGARILVECKAYRDKQIAAEVLAKLMGNVQFEDYSAGWLISTSNLSKDAQGRLSAQRQKPTEQRQRLVVYDPEELCALLISTREVVDPQTLVLPPNQRVLRSRTLMLTDIGEFWLCQIVGERSGVADGVIAFDAASGARITSEPLVGQLRERDSNLRNFEWIASEEELSAKGALADASLSNELDSISAVPMADDWSDYRPARPEDFVGRDNLFREMLAFRLSHRVITTLS